MYDKRFINVKKTIVTSVNIPHLFYIVLIQSFLYYSSIFVTSKYTNRSFIKKNVFVLFILDIRINSNRLTLKKSLREMM